MGTLEPFSLIILDPASSRNVLSVAVFVVNRHTGVCDLIRKITDYDLSDCCKVSAVIRLLGEETARRADMPIVFVAPSNFGHEHYAHYRAFCLGFKVGSSYPVTLISLWETRGGNKFTEIFQPYIFGQDEDFKWIENALLKGFPSN